MTDAYRRIPYCVPSWGWPEHFAIFKGLLLGRIINGPHLQALYSEVNQLTGIPFIFGFDSGETAITACLKASGIGPGDQVIMPSFCCHSVAEAILHTGAAPCFCEIQQDMNPDVGHILELLQPSVKAIIFPHLFGRPGDIMLLEDQLIKKGIRDHILLIDDAAQSFGAKINGRYLGSFGDAGIISFGAGKMTTASGGGLLLTRSERLAGKIKALNVRSPGLVRQLKRLIYWMIFRRWRKYSIRAYRYLAFLFKSPPNAEEQLCKLADIDAAIALAQIKRIRDLIAVRRSIRLEFERILTEIQQNSAPIIKHIDTALTGSEESFTKFIFFLNGINQETGFPDPSTKKFYSYLKRFGVELQPLYDLLHLHPKYSRENISLPFSEKLVDRAINLCTDPTFSSKDIIHIAKTMKRYFEDLKIPQESV